MAKDPMNIHMEGDQPYSMSSEGVEKGTGMRTFYFKSRQTGKMMGPFSALGRRNLEFRRAEAEKGGYEFHECEGGACAH